MRKLEIDWPGLQAAFQMNLPEIRCFFALDEGFVLKLGPDDPKRSEAESDPTRYQSISALPSRIQYQWLDDFISSVEDTSLRAKLEEAINGKGAFRRFKDLLMTVPDERRRWFEYRDAKIQQRIEAWIEDLGIEATNPPNWEEDTEAPQNPTAPNVVFELFETLRTWQSDYPENTIDTESLRELAKHLGKTFRVLKL